MNYYELRKEIAKLVPRQKILSVKQKNFGLIKEKGRKTNYAQFDLTSGQWKKNERLLNTEEFKSFIEISLRAAACPMPLNIDVWDGLLCPYRCRYCFSDLNRYKLFTAFFDNAKIMGFRSCSPDYFKRELDKYFNNKEKALPSDIQRAITNNIPIRLGIRFENFHSLEKKKGVALEMLRYLAQQSYPVMINTKSDLIAEDEYIRALADNPGKAAIHITLISSDDVLLKKLEPAAPNYKRRLEAMRKLVSAGIRTVARIEPYMVFINDEKNRVDQYIEEIHDVGVQHITFDTYSYSAGNFGVRENFNRSGYDFDRMFLLMSDSQPIGSLLLGKFMDMFRQKEFSCSTFDLGNIASNDDEICCEIGDWFIESKFNRGSIVSAIKYVQRQNGQSVGWTEYEEFVNKNGGFLSAALRDDVFQLWNLSGNSAYSIDWAKGIQPAGVDQKGHQRWKYDNQNDFRMRILEECL